MTKQVDDFKKFAFGAIAVFDEKSDILRHRRIVPFELLLKPHHKRSIILFHVDTVRQTVGRLAALEPESPDERFRFL